MLIYEYDSVGDILKAALDERKARNPRYSLRAFARDLDLSPSRLSEVISKEHRLSQGSAVQVGQKLQLTPQQQEFFAALALRESARSDGERAGAEANLQKYRFDSPTIRLLRDQLELFSSWQPLTLVEALKLAGSDGSIEWLSSTTGVAEDLVKEYVAMLERHGFVETDENGKVHVLKGKSTTAQPGVGPTPETAKRQGHASILHEAIAALDEQPMSERDFSAMIVAASKSTTPEVKEAIKAFRRALTSAAAETKSKDSVYCLSIQWFKLAEAPFDVVSKS